MMATKRKIAEPAVPAPLPENPNKGFGTRVHEARTKVRMTQLTLAKHVGVGRSAIAQWERFQNVPRFDKVKEVAGVLGTTAEWLLYGVDDEPKVVMPSAAQLGYVLVDEVRFGDSPDEVESVRKWGIPADYLRGDMQVYATERLLMFKVDNTCTPYNMGDLVVVDRNTVKPSPPGHFLIWDGIGAQIAHLSVVPPGQTKKLSVRVKTDEQDYTVEADKITVIGRIHMWKKA